MRFRRIPSNILMYSKRGVLWRSNSSPYLSGDLFADNSDISFYPPFLRSSGFSLSEVKSAKVIFCPSHKVERLLQEYGEDLRAKVLILGNSDRDFLEPLPDIPTSIRAVICQNLLFEDPLYIPLPIGVENLRLGTNGRTHLFSTEFSSTAKEKKVLVGPLSNTHMERSEIFSTVYLSSDIHLTDLRLSPKEYARLAAKYQFIASPRGNGQDTHRFWETLYRGGLPIVKSNIWTEQMCKLGIPLVEVLGWSEKEISRAIKNHGAGIQNFRGIPQLWWPWWKSKIDSFLTD
jgi:hypothetical protein